MAATRQELSQDRSFTGKSQFLFMVLITHPAWTQIRLTIICHVRYKLQLTITPSAVSHRNAQLAGLNCALHRNCNHCDSAMLQYPQLDRCGGTAITAAVEQTCSECQLLGVGASVVLAMGLSSSPMSQDRCGGRPPAPCWLSTLLADSCHELVCEVPAAGAPAH